jgi:hypothetical protein
MDEEIIKIIGVLIISMIIIYFLIHGFKINITEGLTNNKSNIMLDFGASSITDSENIKALNITLEDRLLISKYKKDYENLIINLDDYLNNLLLQNVLTIGNSVSSVTNNTELEKQMKSIDLIKSTKQALNETMKYLDKVR